MVMEAKPSPLVVGREFVRQYYTLLHNSPDHLHRFYNQHSSFTHKGWDPDASKEEDDLPIVGQKNIHDKIQAMNFRDCHAKISHVDAQATLGDGVVVQVFGELSNDGHQMRRFTQTFVLACQSPKKYYVHNDILRYHDIYCEDEEQQQREEHETTEAGTVANTAENTVNAGTNMMVQQTVFYPPPPPNNVIASPALIQTGYPNAPVVPGNTTAPPQVNGIMNEEMLKNIATQTSQTQIITAPSIQSPPQVIPVAPAPTALPIPVEPVAVVQDNVPMAVATTTSDFEADQLNGNESDTLDNSKDTDATSSDDVVQQKSSPSPIPGINNNNSSSAPKNWANLVKTGPGLGFTGSPPQPETSVTPTSQSFVVITQQQQQQAAQQKQAENYGSVDRRQVRQAAPNSGGDRERRISNNANNNVNNDGSSQLFLGNLPTAATEEELRQLFSVFGKITDLRIHPKQPQKGGSGRPGPNYGFITFENPSSATRLQEAQPIFYPVLNDKRGTKLNIENKIRKNAESAGNQGRGGNDQNQDRGRNNNPNAGMNRNGSGGRSDRRGGDERNRQFNRSDRMGGPRQTTNGNSGTFTNSRR